MSMDIDPSQLKYHRFTSYKNSFFLLRVPLMINEQLSTIGCSKGMLTLNSRYPSFEITFDILFNVVNTVVKKYGISEVTNCWIEDVPLFELKHSTPDGMKKFIQSAELVQNELTSSISAQLAVASTSDQCLPVVVHTEVFLLTPDPSRKDADLKLVTSENVSICLDTQKKSEVFNFGELFRRFRNKGAPTSHQLLEDLTEHRHQISKTNPSEASYTETKQSPKHCQVPTPEKKSDPKLESKIQQLQSGIESKDKKLVVKKQDVTEAQNARDIARGRLDQVGKKAVETQTKVALPIKKSSDTQGKLDSALKQRKFKGVLDHTDKGVQKLQEELEAIQIKLKQSDQKKMARPLLEQLQQATKDLPAKSAKAQEQEWEQKKLETLLEHERERTVQLRMQASVAPDLQRDKEIKRQLITAKKELRAKTAEVANLKETIAYQDAEVKRLSAELRSREALLQSLLMQLSQATKPDHAQELKSKEELQRLTEEVSELRAKLFRAEDAKQEAQKQMEAAELKSKLLQEIVRESTQIPPPVPPKPNLKPASKSPLSKLPCPGNDTWEYKVFVSNSAEIVDMLANVRLAGRVADKLSAAGIIGKSVTELAHNYGIGITETSRVRHIITVLKDMIQLNPRRYHEFRDILLSLGADTETALHYMPKTDPTTHSSTAKKARTPSKDKDLNVAPPFRQDLAQVSPLLPQVVGPKITDPLFHKSTMMKARISKDQSQSQVSQAYECSEPPFSDTNLRLLCVMDEASENIERRDCQVSQLMIGSHAFNTNLLAYMQSQQLIGYATGQQQITVTDIQWKTGTDTLEEMSRGAAVSDGKTVYFNSYNSNKIYAYHTEQQLWQSLPHCYSEYSALVVAKNKVTTVGGFQDGQPTKSLASLTVEGKWVELLPPMPTARYFLAAVCRGKNVIAAGGCDCGGIKLSTVEILDTDLRKWSSAASLPHPMREASITVCGDLLYLLGGADQNGRTLSVLTSSITDLLHQQQETANQPAVWRPAADTPYYDSTAVSVGGQLLAIGGQDEDRKVTPAIVAYNPNSNSWQNMGHVTTPRLLPLVALLPSNKLIVAGGIGGEKKVEIGNIVIF